MACWDVTRRADVDFCSRGGNTSSMGTGVKEKGVGHMNYTFTLMVDTKVDISAAPTWLTLNTVRIIDVKYRESTLVLWLEQSRAGAKANLLLGDDGMKQSNFDFMTFDDRFTRTIQVLKQKYRNKDIPLHLTPFQSASLKCDGYHVLDYARAISQLICSLQLFNGAFNMTGEEEGGASERESANRSTPSRTMPAPYRKDPLASTQQSAAPFETTPTSIVVNQTTATPLGVPNLDDRRISMTFVQERASMFTMNDIIADIVRDRGHTSLVIRKKHTRG